MFFQNFQNMHSFERKGPFREEDGSEDCKMSGSCHRLASGEVATVERSDKANEDE